MIDRCNTMLSGVSTFRMGWWSHMLSVALFTRAERREIATCLFKAEGTIRTAANTRGVLIVLTVVLPEAHRTDLVSPTLIQREEPAA
jgi:hypothetical protein